MTIKTNYFDGTSYGSADLIAPWGSLLTNGIFGVSTGALNVLAHSPANLSIDAQVGACIINGYYVKNDAIVNVPIVANASGYNRIDNIVINVDTTNKISTIISVQGTPSSSPVAPVLAGNQLLLAQILVGNNVSVLNQNVISDMRIDVDTITQQKYSSYRQALINGNFDIWQRGTSFTGSGYIADRWFASYDGTITKTYSEQAFTVGQTQVPNNPKYFLRTQVTSASGQTFHTIRQRIEDVNTLVGMAATISFWAKADTTKNLALNFVQYFGSGGSSAVSASVSDVSVTLGTDWQKFTVTFNIPSITGKTIGTGDNLTVYFNFPLNTTFTIDIAQIQVNAGTIALPFTPKIYAQESLDCKRYYQKIGYIAIATGTDGAVLTEKNFPVEMRTTPTVYLTDSEAATNTNGYVYDYNANVAIAGFTAGQVSSRGFVTIIKTGACVVGRVYGGGAVLDAEL